MSDDTTIQQYRTRMSKWQAQLDVTWRELEEKRDLICQGQRYLNGDDYFEVTPEHIRAVSQALKAVELQISINRMARFLDEAESCDCEEE